MKHLDDNIILLGLIVATQPFIYSNNIVNSVFNRHIEIDELKRIKNNLNEELNNITNISDEERMGYSDELYFIDKVINELEVHNGNNL